MMILGISIWYWIGAIVLLIILLPVCFPYQALKAFVFLLRHTCYTVRLSGQSNIPLSGPILLVANHVSIFDTLILMGLTKRHIRFMMHQEYYRMRWLHWLFHRIGVIEVPAAGKPKQMTKFLEKTKRILQKGEIVCVFPEGGVSGNGLILRFKKGISRMLPDGIDVPVIPVRMGMLWGSMFTFYQNKLRFIMPRQFPIPVYVNVGRPIPHDVTPYQLRQLISELGADAELDAFPGERPLHYRMAQRAKRFPFKVSFKEYAANGKGKETKSMELLIGALVISRIIRQLDPGPDKYIGVLLPNCCTTITVLHGILFADRTPAILNFTAGTDAREIACEKANLKLILTSRKFLEKLNMPKDDRMYCLEDLKQDAERLHLKKIKRRAIFDALVLPTSILMRKYAPYSCRNLHGEVAVLFSSGSTGKPKGIMLTHHNVTANFFSFWRLINWTPRDRVVGNLPMFHAFGFMVGFVLPSSVGTRCIFIANPLDAAGVCDLIEKEKCTLLIATPTFLQHYMRKYKPGQFKTLRLLVTGAEKLRQDISDMIKERIGLPVTEGFGCTELSPIVCINLSYSIFTLGREPGSKGSVGAPLPGIHVKIVDPETGDELPENTPGLMMVKGALVMKGYLKDPAATSKVIKNGFYNTGDIAAMSPDGYITITGRLSRFSKIAGEMVPHELVEMAINEVLKSEGKAVAVCGAKDLKKGERLLVFYSDPKRNPEEIVAELHKKNLPNLWVPRAADFIKIDQIPILGTGKLDLQALLAIAKEYNE